MKTAPKIRIFLRSTFSATKRTKRAQAATLMAPKMAVRRRSVLPVSPTRSLKYCGPLEEVVSILLSGDFKPSGSEVASAYK